ncbi:hypothetical protein [Streptosporangium sp. NPDC049644]|uniref:hypothetical protein n=1 Tax=Streptosporangium sp. NPDC049644 TaxID=3155507 RepID=UPI00343CFF0D
MLGQICNWKVSDLGWKVDMNDQEGNFAGTVRWVHRGTKKGVCSIGGDSGAPIYTVRSDGAVTAKGIHSGSDANPDGTERSTDCVSYFTDIFDVNNAFGEKIAKWNFS